MLDSIGQGVGIGYPARLPPLILGLMHFHWNGRKSGLARDLGFGPADQNQNNIYIN